MGLIALRRAFVGTSIAWAVALPLATLAAARASTSWSMSVLALAVYAVGAIVCHQRPERSFFLGSHQMPVCARCTGIYIGAAVAVILSVVARRPSDSTLTLSLSKGERVVAALAALPAIATLLYEWTTGVTPANWIRAASGLSVGAAVAALIQREVN